ncbi:MAG: glycoside hydrolase family 16 protein, partial [Proteobacteria bacterium]|nr:glycoside hydrolase family 16 protein [Pseudomonadota bacterium]
AAYNIVVSNAAGSSVHATQITVSASAPPSGPTPPPAPGGGFVGVAPADRADALVWSDEFEGDSLKAGNWDIEMGDHGWGNNELQNYTGKSANLRVRDGMLEIVATATGAAGSRRYESARIRTAGKQSFIYPEGGTVRIEARMTLPGGQGLWPAFWMLPEDYVYGGWPRSGEIDIMEAVNLGAGNRRVTSWATHYGLAWPRNAFSTAELDNVASPQTDFHIFAVEWELGEIRWYINDRHVHTQTSKHWFIFPEDASPFEIIRGGKPFDQRFHLLLNVAVGGNFPGPVSPQTQFPQSMLVDWVRVYNCATGQASSRCFKDPAVTTHDFSGSGGFTTGNGGTLTATVYADGLQSFTDTDQGGSTATFAATAVGTGAAVNVDATDGTDQVAELTFTAADSSVAFAIVEDATVLDVDGAQVYGQLVFDLKVAETAPGAGLSVRIVDVNGQYLARAYTARQLDAIKNMAGGTQTQVLTLNRLQNSGSFSYRNVVEVLAVHATGTYASSQQTVVQVDDIRLQNHCRNPGNDGCVMDLSSRTTGPVSQSSAVELDVTSDTEAYPNQLVLYNNGIDANSPLDSFFTFPVG